MHPDFLDLLHCPACHAPLRAEADERRAAHIETGTLRCGDCDAAFPVVRGIPRFVPADNYASNFGFQWNRFSRTQLDSHSGSGISRDRFYAQSGWSPEALAGRWVLDVGCGAGRFAEVALAAGAHVVALDYSTAADAAWRNLGSHERLHVLQADVFALPLRPARFDFVYCFGVLQHTPDAERAVRALPPMLRDGGRLAVDIYPKLLRNVFSGKYWVRPITTRIPQDRLFALVERLVPVLYPVNRRLARVRGVGRQLRHLIPVSTYDGVLALGEAQLREWAVLDTFDMLAPRHDHPQSGKTLGRWLRDAGLRDVEVFRLGVFVGRGSR